MGAEFSVYALDEVTGACDTAASHLQNGVMMFRRTSLLAGVSFVLFAACSSPKEAASVTDTGSTTPPEDTAPVEDTAPWLKYPEGPYGLTKGSVFPNLTLNGYRNGVEGKAAGEFGPLSMLDYYDPTGDRKIYAILFVVSAEWCNPCRIEAKELPRFWEDIYKHRGARFITSMFEDSKSNPANQATLDRWLNAYSLPFDIAADPDAESIPEGAAIPLNYIINPRDMKIYRINTGAVGSEATKIDGLRVLLDYNGAPPEPAAADAGTTD